MWGDVFLTAFQGRNSQYLSEWRIGMGCVIMWYSHDSSPLPSFPFPLGWYDTQMVGFYANHTAKNF